MTYTPTEWNTGDVITAEKLNNMEDGIKNLYNTHIEYVTISATRNANTNVVTASADKTWDELLSMIESGATVIAVLDLTISNGEKYRAKTTLEVNINAQGNFTKIGCSFLAAHAVANANKVAFSAYHFYITASSVTGDFCRVEIS